MIRTFEIAAFATLALLVASPAAWAGDQLAFGSNRDGEVEVYVMELSDRSVRQLTDNTAYDSQPTWSPDGERIAFVLV